MAADLGAAHRAGHAGGLAGRDLEQREALEQPHVAHGLAVEPGLRGDGVDEVGLGQPGGAAAGGDQLHELAGAVGVVRLAVAARRLRRRRRGDVRALGPRRHGRARVALDRLQVALLARLDERDRAARAADAAGAPDPVHVHVRRRRDVEVHDVGDVRDVEPAGRDVGRHQDRQAPALERDHHAVARALGHVAVQRLDVHALVAQRPVELLGADLRAREDDRLLRALGLQHAHERLDLVLRLGLQEELLDRVDRQRRGLDLDRHRVVQVALRQRADRPGHRGAEQRRLAAVGHVGEDLLDVLEEAEVEHLVGLVEHDVAARVQDQRVARDQVEHAADRADHDRRARLQVRLLVADRRAAEHGDRVDPLVGAVGAERLRDLDAQLARRREHERLDLRILGVDRLEHRQPERGGLAGAGLRLADHVTAFEQHGNRLLLDRARRLIAHVLEGGEEVLGQPEVGEGRHVRETSL